MPRDLSKLTDAELNREFTQVVAKWRFHTNGCTEPAWWRHDDTGAAIEQASAPPNYVRDLDAIMRLVPPGITLRREQDGWLASFGLGGSGPCATPARAVAIALLRNAELTAAA